MNFTRRDFVGGLTLAGTAGLLGVRPDTASAEPPPETTTLRIADRRPGICIAPQYVARGEGAVRVPPLSGQARLRQRDAGERTKAPDRRVSRALGGAGVAADARVLRPAPQVSGRPHGRDSHRP